MSYTCKYFMTINGRMPAKEFIDTLNEESRIKFYQIVGYLEKNGRALLMPHARYMGDEIFELRFVSDQGATRVLYFFYEHNDIILTNGFIKKTNKTPAQEIYMAKKRRKEYMLRKMWRANYERN